MNIVSLFSGAGAMDIGFIKQGFKIIWANDFERAACETYAKNIGNHIINKNILEVESKDIPDCDGVIGGSPCQGFSNSNRYTNFLDNPKNFLVKEFIRIVKDKNPNFFVLENVPQIITAGNGKFAQEIVNELSDYHIEIKILNAVDFDSAQKRKRAIFIGCRNGVINHPKPFSFINKTVADAFMGLTEQTPNQNDYSKSNEETVNRISFVPQGGNWRDMPKELQLKWTHSSMYRRLKFNEPSTTIVNFRKTMLLHPVENRILSVREAARLQGFTDDFVFYGSMSEKQQMVANAVPVELSEAIAIEVKNKFIQTFNAGVTKDDVIVWKQHKAQASGLLLRQG